MTKTTITLTNSEYSELISKINSLTQERDQASSDLAEALYREGRLGRVIERMEEERIEASKRFYLLASIAKKLGESV